MFKLSARQILSVALLSAILAAAATGVSFFVAGTRAASAFAETTQPAGITDPAVAPDERNNVEVYRAIAPGCPPQDARAACNGSLQGDQNSSSGQLN